MKIISQSTDICSLLFLSLFIFNNIIRVIAVNAASYRFAFVVVPTTTTSTTTSRSNTLHHINNKYDDTPIDGKERRCDRKQQQQQQRMKKSMIVLHEMKRPILDQIATKIYQLENNRVNASSVYDEKGRYGEPMEWSNTTSLANQVSVLIASNPIGYQLKQFVANIIAGTYNEEEITNTIQQYIQQDTIVMFSFTTCPFCRKAKDILEERNISYTAIELDMMDDDNNNNYGNIIRAQLGKLTKRTSMPNIFINGKCIGGCNDGYPGLIPLIESGQFDTMLTK